MNEWTEWGQGFMFGLLLGGFGALVLVFLSAVLLSVMVAPRDEAEDEGE